jgi:hypothetical protein
VVAGVPNFVSAPVVAELSNVADVMHGVSGFPAVAGVPAVVGVRAISGVDCRCVESLLLTSLLIAVDLARVLGVCLLTRTYCC